MHSPYCLCDCEYPLNQSLWNLVRNHGTSVHLKNITSQIVPISLCVYMCITLSLLGKGSVKCIPPFIAGQQLGKYVPAAVNTLNSRRIVEHVCLWVCQCIPLSLLGNNLVNMFPRKRRIIRGVVPLRDVSFQKKVGDYFFPELHLWIAVNVLFIVLVHKIWMSVLFPTEGNEI
jgi:hypothetical protein